MTVRWPFCLALDEHGGVLEMSRKGLEIMSLRERLIIGAIMMVLLKLDLGQFHGPSGCKRWCLFPWCNYVARLTDGSLVYWLATSCELGTGEESTLGANFLLFVDGSIDIRASGSDRRVGHGEAEISDGKNREDEEQSSSDDDLVPMSVSNQVRTSWNKAWNSQKPERRAMG